jgi:hypothetical protein
MAKRHWFIHRDGSWEQTAEDLYALADQMRFNEDVHAVWHELETAAAAIDDLLSENEDLKDENRELLELVDKLEGATPKPSDQPVPLS